ncbi:probable tyrosyl-DNA phosphodiesterase isoform X2 [Venturia canescens]|uniref:probable tyrosyl-DNA phosphodiesterase isoform X2 n=1 Tax=Venturia canescens TaxID=32260 RepID=UPI001C9CCA79|nr:probable tyrosyl-DNA phosphodiesterase isoform X2 [Venturia canescens]
MENQPELGGPGGGFLHKWERAHPYYMFFNDLSTNEEHPLSVKFSDLLDGSMGEIRRSLHTTLTSDLEWMWQEYVRAGLEDQIESITVFRDADREHTDYAHVKIYRDEAIRIVVFTGNLKPHYWRECKNGLWVSPSLPRMVDSAADTDGDSPTGFKSDFLLFLRAYDDRMNDWIDIVKRADCSAVNVAFVASVPGVFPNDDARWGHKKLRALLHEHMVIPENKLPTTIIIQTLEISEPNNAFLPWVREKMLRAMVRPDENETLVNLHLLASSIGPFLPNSSMAQFIGESQADRWCGSNAPWHIKSYARLYDDDKKILFFVMGSANLSKAAWGHDGFEFGGISGHRVLSYEANVVFFPKFVTGQECFFVREDPGRQGPIFALPYDLPLIPHRRFNPRAWPAVNAV